MDIDINRRIIEEMCGTVSFKRGDSFYREDKVVFENYSMDRCEAIVKGSEDYYVTIKKTSDGGFHTTCSCPKLASYKLDCQHIAAVLLAIYEHERQGDTPQPSVSTNRALTEGLMTIFNDRPLRTSRKQLHFEKRKVVHFDFICKLVQIGNEQQMIGIDALLESYKIEHIRGFLEHVKNGNTSELSSTFTYDPSLHCFQQETDDVIQQLIQVMDDETVYFENRHGTNAYTSYHQTILIPPSSWERLMTLLTKEPSITLEYDRHSFEGINLSKESLPLQFAFLDEGGGYKLKVIGLNEIHVLNSYGYVLSDGKFIRLENEDFKRLIEIKQMLGSSGTNEFSVPQKQLHVFIEKVIPGLKKLGVVQLPDSITKMLEETPLVAKLYLDRLKNRLLAGLEFHYGNIVINPLENRELHSNVILIRDVEKESTILKIMEESSFARTESGYFLHNEELEFDFLYYIVPKMNKLVQVYATTAVRNRIFRENPRPRIRVKVSKERTNWLEFKFEMDGIFEKHIREILLALEEKRKYYRLPNGSLFSLTSREFDEVNRFLNAIPSQPEDLESGLNVPIVQGLKLLDSVNDDQLFELETSFRHFLENIYNLEEIEFEIPQSLEHVLRDYQKNGFKWMKTLAKYGFGGILADDMGLGKTLQSITFILSELSDIRTKKRPALIVCPSSLMYNWYSEFMKFTPNVQVMIIDGNKKERMDIQKDLADQDVIITSYPLLRKDTMWFEKQAFHTVIFDEAQVFKNPTTQTARAVKRIQADHRFGLTGTPVENALEELWSIFYVVFPELFQGLKEYSSLTKKQIARRIRPFMLRRLKEDVLSEIPEKIESRETVELLPDQKKLYAAYLAKLKHETLKHLDKDTLRKNRIKILAGITRLRQICCHPALFVDGYNGGSAKLEQLMQIIKESKLSGRRVLIFSQFTKMLQIIGKELAYQGLPFFYLDGHTPSEERLSISNRFNAGERDLFLISLKAGGTGLNLTGADTVILYDSWWNPAVEEQAADRAHRIGQKNTVEVIKLVARGTIEEKMNELQEQKRHLIEEVIDSEDKALSTLTEEDIREILMV
ncbi:SNF2 helicase associated domain-containing protein [Lederbergia wuyishanensis]|uniref:SNF2 family DNA or RNA helicase n=1 Tax=Lederbergia wuyishanensis TaxID=1347903 RepID=A0ABU0D2S2_9BACI|nr:SNF2 helicase associated domain-containing protein [Lederbergia wuyishanensis]MCJ8007147.1 DEAD/DEAH box helicase [Lederbergia wuyishanensis]MDQ0342708.1 SNF2 family DNA or RNA helicase [Lederbergia wuyishanensis]